MMLQELRSIKSTRKELRQFSYVMAVAGAVIGCIMFFKHNPLFPWFLGGALLFITAGLTVPVALLPLQKLWMGLSVILGWIMARVILTVLFYVIITPLGLTARLFGKDFLGLKIDKTKDSYWIHRDKTPFEKERYENQF